MQSIQILPTAAVVMVVDDVVGVVVGDDVSMVVGDVVGVVVAVVNLTAAQQIQYKQRSLRHLE